MRLQLSWALGVLLLLGGSAFARRPAVGASVELAGYTDSTHIHVASPSVAATVSDENAGWSVGGRYLVDAWATNVEMSSDRAAFDLEDQADQARVLELFGDPRTWTRRIEAHPSEFSWVPTMPSQLAALARSV